MIKEDIIKQLKQNNIFGCPQCKVRLTQQPRMLIYICPKCKQEFSQGFLIKYCLEGLKLK